VDREGNALVLDEEFKKLEEQVGDLVRVCQRLKRENSSLRQQERDLLEQNTKLSEKNRIARTRIEAIIGKLKSMEQG
jgi:cell division protein ZapB